MSLQKSSQQDAYCGVVICDQYSNGHPLLSRKRKEPLHSASSTDATFASPQQYNVRLGRVTSGIPRRLRMEHWDHDRDKLISASVQWARRILEKIDAVFQSSMRDGRRGHWIVFDEWLHFQAHVI